MVLPASVDVTGARNVSRAKLPSVNRGNAASGRAVDVPSGKRLLATERADLAIMDIPQPPDTWEINFEEGLTALPRAHRPWMRLASMSSSDLGVLERTVIQVT
jgi:hypothetical protein